MKVARALLEGYETDGVGTLRFWHGGWMHWRTSQWDEIEDSELKSLIYKRLEHAEYRHVTRDGPELRPWAPNRRKVADVLDAARGITHLPESVDTPAWLNGGGAPARGMVACRNGLLHIGTRELLKHTPAYFNRVSVPFDYDPNVPTPNRWLGFLNQLWPGDPDSIAALQEWFGYVLSGRTDLQKILLLVGPTRSGKGTIARVLENLIGEGNVAAPTMASFNSNFGLATLLGKSLAIVGDARVGGADVRQAVERLLSISGEDSLDVDRKHRDQWTGKLPTRLVLLSNELPRFSDASEAIAHRFLVLTLSESFLGREDTELAGYLLAELPGILGWALDGMDRLTRQSFTIPASSKEATETLLDLASPTAAFVREECECRSDIEIQEIYAKWRRWCEGNGHHRPTTSSTFGRDLRAVIPGLRVVKPHGQPRRYVGVTLKRKLYGPSGSSGANEPGQPSELGRFDPADVLPGTQNCRHCGDPLDGPPLKSHMPCKNKHRRMS
jgi:putative DNA primase/helicase